MGCLFFYGHGIIFYKHYLFRCGYDYLFIIKKYCNLTLFVKRHLLDSFWSYYKTPPL